MAIFGCLLVAIGMISWVWPVRAAIQLEYFDVLTIGETLRLQWGTVVENDLAAFEIYCKEEEEPLSAYHVIGTRLAQGSNEEGAQYQFDIATGIEPGVAYCFRLKEITLDGRPGDILDFCGYGINITPLDATQVFEILPPITTTPAITTTVEISSTQIFTVVEAPTSTITPIIINIPATTTPAATTDTSLTTTLVITEATPTVISSNGGILVLPTETPTPAITATPTASPTALDDAAPLTETIDVSPTVTITAQMAGDQESPLPSPTASPILTPISEGTPTVTSESAITQTETATETVSDDSQSAMVQRSGTAGVSPLAADQAAADTSNVAAPPYIVLTATPIEAPIPIIPTFTPFPTAVAMSEVDLLAAALPSQNLMILLICGIFSGASGLGVLGIVTTLLYMRSRSSERRNGDRRL